MSLNEFQIIREYFVGLTAEEDGVIQGIGDDGAVLSSAADRSLIVATDTLISGVHFFPDSDPYDIGHKSLAVNLSDMAAMGARPRWFTLALTLSDQELGEPWLSGFSRGLKNLANHHSIGLVGGDLNRGPLSITIHMLGECPKGQAITRSGAKAGDAIYVSGPLGTAAWALAMLDAGEGDIKAKCSEKLFRPAPRVELGLSLRGIASAMIDISDGLLADLGHILRASEVGACLHIEHIPHDAALEQEENMEKKWRYILAGGDDYELCFTLPPSRQGMLRNISQPCYHIGEITKAMDVLCQRDDGTSYKPEIFGYSHF